MAGSSEKYSRQVLFTGLGAEGQQRLQRSSAVIVGCGALGSCSANALARAGIGRLLIVDRDFVEPSNLQRQMLFDEDDAAQGLPKAVAAERHLRRINSDVRVEGRIADVTPENVESLLAGFPDVVLDGTDNFETRYLLNDACVKLGIPWIYAAAVGSRGMTMPVVPGRTVCLACVFPDLPEATETCDTAGILSSAASAVASIQAADALKILSGALDKLESRLLTLDVWENKVHSMRLGVADPACLVCARREFIHLSGERRPQITMCGRNSVQIHEHNRTLDLAALRLRLEPLGAVRANEFMLRFVLAPYEMTVFADGRAIVKGTTDAVVARSLYARYLGS